MTESQKEQRVIRVVEDATDEIVAFAAELIRVPTVNPPGAHYRDCAELFAKRITEFGFQSEFIEASGRPEHTVEYPRVNVIGTRDGSGNGPTVHLNGHMDVVPPGDGWTLDPFEAHIADGKLFGRGSADMKAGIAAAVFAAEALRRAGIDQTGTIRLSATVDEESGGHAGVEHLCETGIITQTNTDFVIIPEPLNVDRICLGHRGVYWFRLTTSGRVAHGSMPFLGISAIDHMTAILGRINHQLKDELADITTSMPVVPPEAKRSTINVNSIVGGQANDDIQTPCVADRCTATFDLRFPIEEGLEDVRRRLESVLDGIRNDIPEIELFLTDLLTVHPTMTDSSSPLVTSLRESIDAVLGTDPQLVVSPGTYDQKHFARIAGIKDCVAYGPGILEQAHRADEYCLIEDITNATKVMALTLLKLVGAN